MINEFLARLGGSRNGQPITRGQQLINDGSDTYEYAAGVIAAGVTVWIDIAASFPRARTYFPLDSIEVINNSAQPIGLYLNSRSNVEVVPAYMIKPIAGEPVNQFGLKNAGLVDTVAGEVLVHLKRLPPNIQVVISGGTVR